MSLIPSFCSSSHANFLLIVVAVTVSEHRSANVSTPHRVVLKRNQSGKEGVAERDILLQSFFSGCSWNQGHWWTVVHFWNSISVSGLNFPSCVCCKCQIISSTTYHKDANLKVLQLKPISPLEQNHGNRGICGGGVISHVDVCVQKELSWSQGWYPEWQYTSSKKCQWLLEISSLLIKFMCMLQIRTMVCASLTIWCWPKIPLQIHLCSSGEPQSRCSLVFTFWYL